MAGYCRFSMAAPQGEFYRLLGKSLASARQAAKLTQAKLAAVVGLSRTSIANIESGRQPVQVHLLVRIAEALGKEPGSLLPATSRGTAEATASERAKLERLGPSQRAWVERFVIGGGKTRKGR